MSGGKQSPRQKMIGMMYLVLTALLALNISKEIINAFITIDSGLKQTNSNFDTKNLMTYKAFDKAKQNDPVKAKVPYENAMQAKKLSADLCAYITDLRGKMVAISAGVDHKVGDTLRLTLLDKPDDYDNPTHYMVGSDPSNITGEAKPLKEKLIAYYGELVKLVPKDKQKDFQSRIQPSIPTEKVYSAEHGEMVPWEEYNFYHAPIVAAIAQMDRIINDVKNAEGDAVNELFASINANDFKFDKLTAEVVAANSYVFTGDHYTADVFVGAFNSTQNPSIWLCDYDSVTKKTYRTCRTNRGVIFRGGTEP
jgi:gliding motility-associated protein GldM